MAAMTIIFSINTICMEQQFTPTVAMLASPGSWTTNLANPFTVGTVEDLPTINYTRLQNGS